MQPWPTGRCLKGTLIANPQGRRLPYFVRFIEAGDTRQLEIVFKFHPGRGPTSYLIPFAPRVPLWRSEMFNSQGHCKLSLILTAASFLTIAGCSNQAKDQATNQSPPPAKKVAAPAKPAAKKAEPAKAVTAKGATAKPEAAKAKPVSVSSKVRGKTTLF